MSWLLLGLLGLGVGFLGTLVGAGGGFLLVPILVLMYPDEEPSTITAISLVVVFFNALSGSIGYYARRRIDIKASLRFALAAIPGAVAGAVATTYISRSAFELILGVVMVIAGLWMFFVKRELPEAPEDDEVRSRWGPRIEHSGLWGAVISFGVGFISSLLGIGGGIIHVPAMVYALGFPVHVATATSHFVLASTAFAGSLVHVVTGAFHHGIRRTVCLSIGVVIGAQFGALAAGKLKPGLILRVLAVALAVVGVRILVHAISGVNF